MKKELKNYLLVGIIMFVLLLGVGCAASTYTITIDGTEETVYFPIAKGLYGEGGSWDWLVYPMAWLINFIAFNIVNGNYALTILITTILIRSLAWPIYGKSNDMNLKMKLLGPEQARIEEKYKDKTDKESQQRKSMEMMQLYKKYKISFLGCFTPFLQMPIFLAFYETLRRIPFTNSIYEGLTFVSKKGTEIVVGEMLYKFGDLNTKFFGTSFDLLLTASEGGTVQKWGVYILAALVGITQLGTQFLSQRRMKKQKDKMDSNLPAYRRPEQNAQQKQTDSMMKIMMYTMPIIMVVFIIQSNAALGWYWFVGNLFTALQTLISGKTSEKKFEKMKSKFEEKSYIGVRGK